MSKELSAEWEQRIETEGHEITKRFKDNNDYQSGYIQGIHDGYDQGATKYVKELIEAQERIKSLEETLLNLMKLEEAKWTLRPDVKSRVWEICNEALSPVNPQNKEDE